MQQKEIANKINFWQANVSRTINGTHLLKIEQLLTLLSHSKYTKQDITQNLEEIRIGCLTKLEPKKDVLNFLKEFKLF